METLTATAKVSQEGMVTLPVPDSLKGVQVKVLYSLEPQEAGVPRDAKGWQIGFFEKYVGCIKDPKFKRYPQGEADPPPSFE